MLRRAEMNLSVMVVFSFSAVSATVPSSQSLSSFEELVASFPANEKSRLDSCLVNVRALKLGITILFEDSLKRSNAMWPLKVTARSSSCLMTCVYLLCKVFTNASLSFFWPRVRGSQSSGST